MRIVLTCPYDWGSPGGVQVHVRQLRRRLRDRGHDVLILAPARHAGTDRGVAVVGRPLRVRYQGTVSPISFSVRSARRIERALSSFRPEVLHVHEPLSPSTSMLATLRAGSVPVVATFHAHAERSLLLDAAAPLLRPVWRRLRLRIAVSEAAASFVRSRFGDDIRIVANGCEVEAFRDAVPAPSLPEGRRVVWVNRLDPQKGFRIALRAFAEVAPEHPDLRFLVVGDGRDREALRSLPPEVRGRIAMAGAVAHERLPGLLAGAALFVSPALGQESFGMVLVEAMAAGVPVVASDIAGYREVIRDGVDGLLVPPGDSRALASAMRRILSDLELAGRLRRAGPARAERFGWETVVADLEAAYREAVVPPS